MPAIIAALHTPRRSDGALDLIALRANLAHVLAQPISGVCINGASGEYWISTLRKNGAARNARRRASSLLSCLRHRRRDL
ncbi:MAG: hypothetical protein WKF30_07805 [Pyrinomonadaceae bacterium]